MPEKWLDVVKDNIESGDEKQISWQGRLEKKNGYIVLTKKKVLFIEEHGFLNKTATLMFNHTYNDISKVEIQGDQVKLIDSNGATRILETQYSNNVLKKLEELRKK